MLLVTLQYHLHCDVDVPSAIIHLRGGNWDRSDVTKLTQGLSLNTPTHQQFKMAMLSSSISVSVVILLFAFGLCEAFVSSVGIRVRKAAFCPLKVGMFEDFMDNVDAAKLEEENKRYLSQLQQRVDNINALEAEIEDLGDDELVAKTEEFRQRLNAGEDISGKLLEEAFAVVREAAWYVFSGMC